jgi:hypothetical protein
MLQMKFDVWFTCLVTLPEIGLFIWGNTFIYGQEMQSCKDSNTFRVEELWYASLVVIIYGYFMMIASCAVCVVGCGLLKTYHSWTTGDYAPRDKKVDKLAEKVP